MVGIRIAIYSTTRTVPKSKILFFSQRCQGVRDKRPIVGCMYDLVHALHGAALEDSLGQLTTEENDTINGDLDNVGVTPWMDELTTNTSETADRQAAASRLHTAIDDGDVSMVHTLLEETPSLVNAPLDADANTALHIAAEGEGLIVDILIESCCDVDNQNAHGTTALMKAARYEDASIVQRLLEMGARTHLTDAQGNSALHYAQDADVRRALGLPSPRVSSRPSRVGTGRMGRRMAIAEERDGGGWCFS
jgi:hypothetical protein